MDIEGYEFHCGKYHHDFTSIALGSILYCHFQLQMVHFILYKYMPLSFQCYHMFYFRITLNKVIFDVHMIVYLSYGLENFDYNNRKEA